MQGTVQGDQWLEETIVKLLDWLAERATYSEGQREEMHFMLQELALETFQNYGSEWNPTVELSVKVKLNNTIDTLYRQQVLLVKLRERSARG